METINSRMWIFLNSSFGLWLLSAVFVSGAGKIYTDHQNRIRETQQKEEIRQRQEQQEKETARLEQKTADSRKTQLILEFSFRVSSTIIRLQEAHLEKNKSNLQRLRTQALAPLSDSTAAPYSLFPEFHNRSGLSVLAEFFALMRGGEGENLTNAVKGLSGVITDPLIADPVDPDYFKKIAGVILEELQSLKTFDTGFRFNDCTKENPFC